MLSLVLVCFLLSSFTFSAEVKSPKPSQTEFAKEIKLTDDNVMLLAEEVTQASVTALMVKAAALDSTLGSEYPIYLVLYTPGGDIQAGLELIDFLKGLHRPIHTITLFAASMGFQIAQQLGDRYIIKFGTLMSHKARGAIQGEFGDRMSQIDSRYGHWLNIVYMLDMATVKRTNGKQTLESYRAQYQNELWMTGDISVKGGYADSVVQVSCDSGLYLKNRILHVDYMGLNLEVTFSGCPMILSPISIKILSVSTNQGEMAFDSFAKEGGKLGECSATSTVCAVNNDVKMSDVYKKMQEIKDSYENSNKTVKYSF